MSATLQIRPQPTQEQFLSSSADVVIFGGSAGGGKSYALLLECLRHINNPGFGAVILRRTYPEIVREGSLLDTSMQIYPMVGGRLKRGTLEWVFPSGAKISFNHCQYDSDILKFQGSQIALIALDELTNFATDKVFWYLFSRNRSTCGVKPYIRCSTNPDSSSWVKQLIDWWIDEDTGLAIPERSGVIQWFVRHQGELIMERDRTELINKYPDLIPKSLTFIRSTVYDNRALLDIDPNYIASLQALHPVDQARLLDGNWKIQVESGAFINRSFFEIVEDFPDSGTLVRAWDMAGTEKHLKNDPDYTCGVKMLKSGNLCYVLDVIQVQISAAQVNDLILRTALNDGVGCKVRFEIEPGSAGKINASTLTKMLVGYDAAGIRSQGDKLTRAKGFATAAANGQVKLVRAAWCDRYLS
ncbi:MAG: terminase large subunit domain-containing protein, partial [Chroococcidiopsis sp.]